MDRVFRSVVWLLLAAGLVISILSGTDLCNFGGCTEAHKYRIFRLPFPPFGIAFFVAAGVVFALGRRRRTMELLFSLMVAGAAGAEVNMILLQKNVLQAWCPLCLGLAGIVYLLTALLAAKHLFGKEEATVKFKPFYKILIMFAFGLLGFTATFYGIGKDESAAASLLNYDLGKKDSKLEIYFFSDWLCPICATVEKVIEAEYPAMSQKARLVFLDKVIHPESMNFIPYHLSFQVHEKQKYMALRKALFAVAKKTKNPSYDDIAAAIAPYKVNYKQLSFMDVTQQMGVARQLADQFKVTATPVMVIRNAKTGKTKTLVGNKEITTEKINKAMKELE